MKISNSRMKKNETMTNPLLSGRRNLLTSSKITLLQALMLLKKTGRKCIIVVDKKKTFIRNFDRR